MEVLIEATERASSAGRTRILDSYRAAPALHVTSGSLSRVLTDRGTEYCGNPERHEYELYLAVEDVDHTRTKTKNRQTNGICERCHRTVLDEFYRVAVRKRSTARSMSCRSTSTHGSLITTASVLTRAAGATARLPCRP